MKRLKLVLSCYACEPNRGSEPGVGWAWALGMAKRHETYVLTRANNREVIEAELARLQLRENETPKFIYVDFSPFACRLKKRGIIPVSLYYLLWQFKARKTLDASHLNADIIHHVTFNSFVFPGVWWNRKELVVLGPLGGMCICPRNFLRLFRRGRKVYEIFRTVLLRMWSINLFYQLGKRHADAMIFIDEKTMTTIGVGAKRTAKALETAVPEQLEDCQYDSFPDKSDQFVFAGVFEPRKGLEIALRAYKQAFGSSDHPPLFKIFGSGSDLDWCKKLVEELGIGVSVLFCGKVPQIQLWEEIRKSKALIFPSVRDTSGNVALEAMAVQTPVICFCHQGVAEITDEVCAIRVKSGNFESSIKDFSKAMKRLNSESDLVRDMGRAGRKRAVEIFSWRGKFDQMDRLYSQLGEGYDKPIIS